MAYFRNSIAIVGLLLLVAGCTGSRVTSRRRSVPPSIAPTPAPAEPPSPDVPRPNLDRGDAAPPAGAPPEASVGTVKRRPLPTQR